MYPLFGCSELGVSFPVNAGLEAAVGGYMAYLQLYTPTIRAMEKRVPLATRPNLLVYLLGCGYVSRRSKFKKVWKEVHTQRTKYELLKFLQPSVPLEARLEVVLTEDDPSFLESFVHRTIACLVVTNRLLVKVSEWEMEGRKGSYPSDAFHILHVGTNSAIYGICNQAGK